MANKQLVDYVSQNLLAGTSEEEVKRTLAGVGWQTTEIDEAFNALKEVKTEAVPATPNVQPQGMYGDGSMIQTFDLGLPETADQAKINRTPDTINQDHNQLQAPVQPFPPITTPTGPATSKESMTDSVVSGARKVSPVAVLIKVGIAFLLTCGAAFLVWWWFSGQAEVPMNLPAVVNTPTSEPVVDRMVNTNSSLSDDEYVSNKGFMIRAPKNWVADESGLFGTLVTFSNPIVDENEGNKFAANINVVMEASQTVEISEYLEISRENLEKTLSSYKKTGERPVTVNDQTAVLVEADFEIGVYQLHNMQLVVKKGQVFYLVTGTTMTSEWDVHKKVIEEALMTFR